MQAWGSKNAKFVDHAIYRCEHSGIIKIWENAPLRSICYRPHHLTLSDRARPIVDGVEVEKDALESRWSKQADDLGGKVLSKLREDGVKNLSHQERHDWCRFLMSLAARETWFVDKVRQSGETLRDEADSDPELCQSFLREFKELPSAWAERTQNWTWEDRALVLIQNVAEFKLLGDVLINASWSIMSAEAQLFVLGDRPWVRPADYKDPCAIWALPISPNQAWIAAKQEFHLNELKRRAQYYVRELNKKSAQLAEKYVISTKKEDSSWIDRHLSTRTRIHNIQ